MAKRGFTENKERREGKKERTPNKIARHSLSSLSADVVRCIQFIRDVTTAVLANKRKNSGWQIILFNSLQ